MEGHYGGQMLPSVRQVCGEAQKVQSTSFPPHGDSGRGQTCTWWVPGKALSQLEPSEGFRLRKGTTFSFFWRCEAHSGQFEQDGTMTSSRKRPQQPAGEEAAPASSNNEPPNPPAEERREEQALEEDQRDDDPKEEGAEMRTTGDQDRKRQAENDQSPPKRRSGRPVKTVLPGCKRVSRRKSLPHPSVPTPPANMAAGREEIRGRHAGRKRQVRRNRGLRNNRDTRQEGQNVPMITIQTSQNRRETWSAEWSEKVWPQLMRKWRWPPSTVSSPTSHMWRRGCWRRSSQG